MATIAFGMVGLTNYKSVSRNDACCDVCTPSVPYAVLDMLTPKGSQNKKAPFSAENWESNN